MYKLLTSKGQLFALVLGLLGSAIALLSIISGIKGAGYSLSDDLNQIMKNNADASFDFFNPAIIVVLVLIVLAAAAWIIFGLLGLVQNPKGSMKFLIALVAVCALVGILYSMSDSETTGKIYELIQKNKIAEGTSKMISAGIKTTIGLAIAALVIGVGMELRNAFK